MKILVYNEKLNLVFLFGVIVLTFNLLISDVRNYLKIYKRVDKLMNKLDNLTFYSNKDLEDKWLIIKKNLLNIYNTKYKSSKLNRNNKNGGLLCLEVPNKLFGKVEIEKPPDQFNLTDNNYSNLSYIDNLLMGGKYEPINCTARHKVAIIIPYKNRVDNLRYFLNHMHPFLQRQELEYQIFVIEQSNDGIFNKGILMNAGFLEAMSLPRSKNTTNNNSNSSFTNYSNYHGQNYKFPFDCVIFHDVDLLPEDDRIMYSCPYKRVRHLSVAIDKFNYMNLYERLVGGVLNFKISHFIKVNGYSNEYWGWGGEDDDMEARLRTTNIGYERPNQKIAHYKMLKHDSWPQNSKRFNLLYKAPVRYNKDGLNNVNYTVKEIVDYKMFRHILIEVGESTK